MYRLPLTGDKGPGAVGRDKVMICAVLPVKLGLGADVKDLPEDGHVKGPAVAAVEFRELLSGEKSLLWDG